MTSCIFWPQVKGQNNLQGVVGNQTSYASHLPYQETTRNKLLVLNYLSRCSRTALRKLCRRGLGSQVNFTFRNLSDLALNLTKHKAGRMQSLGQISPLSSNRKPPHRKKKFARFTRWEASFRSNSPIMLPNPLPGTHFAATVFGVIGKFAQDSCALCAPRVEPKHSGDELLEEVTRSGRQSESFHKEVASLHLVKCRKFLFIAKPRSTLSA